MKHTTRLNLVSLLIFVCGYLHAQSPTICPINAGPDQTICVPNCATLTGTFVPTFQTTSYVTSTIPYAPDPYNAGTALALGDDQWSPVIPLPFTFCFFGTSYNSILIGSNGILSFNTAPAGGYCQWPISAAMPSASDPANSIGGPWQDLYLPGGGTLKYATYGATPCRRFVVSWYQVAMYSCTTTLCTQQLVLYETTNIIDNFIQSKGTCGWNGGYAIQGIQNAACSAASVQAGRNYPTVWTAVNDGKRWSPNGAPTYVCSWYQGASPIATAINVAAGTATATVCPTTTTTYTLQETSTNCNGVPQTVSDQMIVNVSQLLTSAGPDQNICTGGCTNLTCTAAGATGFSWVTIPGNTNVGNTATINVCPGSTTTYVCTATSPTCSGTDTVIVNVAAMTTASAGIDDSVCTGACTILNGSGGVSYSWSPAGSITGSNLIANPQACPTVTTNYTVTVTDVNGCVGTDQVNVFVAPTPLALNLTSINVSCFGSCNGSAQAVPSGGYPPYTYAWSNATVSSTANNLCAGNISVTVTDAIGCTATANVNITEPTAVSIVSTAVTTANCGQNDGSATISVSGGTPFAGNVYTIDWPASGNSGLTENNLPPGFVTVYAYDQNGCGDTLSINIPNTPGAAVNIVSATMVTCYAACDGSAVAGGVGGTMPYTFTWNTTPTATVNDTATALCPGNYIVTMSDANGCSDTAHLAITEPLQLTCIASGAATICIGSNTTISALPAGGTPTYTYAWTDGTNNWNTSNVNVSPTVTTTYSVTVSDSHGCVATMQTVVVTVNPPLAVTPCANTTVCAGTNVNLTAAGNGGNGTYSYMWTPGNLAGASVNVVVNTTTTYTVIMTDGCSTPADTGYVTVTINPAPTVTFTANTLQGCEPLCVDFTNTTPNTASVDWEFGNNLGSSTNANPTYCFTTPGTFDVTATVVDNIGCTGTTTMTNYITVWPLPDANFSASPNPATMLNNIVSFTDLSNGAPVSWIWSFGQDDSASILQNPNYAFQDSGVFMTQLIITNQYGCQDSITLPIIVQEDFAIYIPNAFTPNGDGHNDYFYPQGMGINPDKYEIMIFDRWGNMIFKSDKWLDGWDGTVQGTSRICQQDTYVYHVSASGPDGNRHQYVGHVNLIR